MGGFATVEDVEDGVGGGQTGAGAGFDRLARQMGGDDDVPEAAQPAKSGSRFDVDDMGPAPAI